MAKVTNKDVNGNPIDLDTMLKKFKRQVENEDIIYECKRREFFMNKKLKLKTKRERLQRLQKRGK